MRIIIIIVLVLGVSAPLVTYLESRNARVDFREGQMAVGGRYYYRAEIPYEAIQYDGIVVGESPKTNLALRTNGIGWPGFGLGWFRNAAGERVFALVRSRQPGQLIYVPTTLGFNVVVSHEDPSLFINEVRARVGHGMVE